MGDQPPAVDRSDEGGTTGSFESAVSDAWAQIEERARTVEEMGGPPPDRSRLKLVALGALIALSTWVWIAPPAFARPEPLSKPTEAELDIGHRIGLFVVADEVLLYRQESGILPATLAQAGMPSEGMTYRVLDDTVFTLSLERAGKPPLTWRSDEPVDELLGQIFAGQGR